MITTLETAARAAWAKKFGVPFTALNEAQWADVFRDEWMSLIQAAFEAIQPIGSPLAKREAIISIIHDIVDSDLDGNLVHVDKAADAIVARLAASPQGESDWITQDGGPNPAPRKMVQVRCRDGSETLLPCPMCGNSAELGLTKSEDERNGYVKTFAAYCTKCNCQVARSSNTDKNGWAKEGDGSVKCRVAEAWNRRTPQPDALPGDLREKIEGIIDPAAFMFSADELGDKVYFETRAVATGKAARILSLIQSERGKD